MLLFSFEDNLVVLPMVVLEELDHLKKADGETGANARKCIRLLEELRQKGNSSGRVYPLRMEESVGLKRIL